MTWQIVLTKQAAKDAQNLVNAGIWGNAERLLEVLKIKPFQNPPPYEKLVGNLAGYYSRRINIQHRLVYQVLKDTADCRLIRYMLNSKSFAERSFYS